MKLAGEDLVIIVMIVCFTATIIADDIVDAMTGRRERDAVWFSAEISRRAAVDAGIADGGAP